MVSYFVSFRTNMTEEITSEDIHRLDLGYRVVCTTVAQIYNIKTGEIVFESLDEKKARKAFQFMRGNYEDALDLP